MPMPYLSASIPSSPLHSPHPTYFSLPLSFPGDYGHLQDVSFCSALSPFRDCKILHHVLIICKIDSFSCF